VCICVVPLDAVARSLLRADQEGMLHAVDRRRTGRGFLHLKFYGLQREDERSRDAMQRGSIPP
jgi:hypothetical protein